MTTNKLEHNVILSFDFGLKRIGTAIGQSVTQTARPLTTLAAKNGEPNWPDLEKIIKKWRPDAFVIGIPLNMDGTEQPITTEAKLFAQTLHQKYKLPVYEMDERLTTKAAREQLFEEGGYRALKSGNIDSVAAQLILENWFREQKNNK